MIVLMFGLVVLVVVACLVMWAGKTKLDSGSRWFGGTLLIVGLAVTSASVAILYQFFVAITTSW